MKTLHLLRRYRDSLAEEAIRAEIVDHAGEGAVTVLLIQDAVLEEPELSAPIFVNQSDIEARGVDRPCEKVDYHRICRMVVEHDRVVVW